MDALWIVFFLVIGACAGSFLNVVIYRLPRGQSIIFPPSHCPACGRSIRWYDNVPLLSWILLRGRCRFCKAAISPRYILVEAGTAALIAGLYICYYVLNIRDDAGGFGESWPMFIAHVILVCGLLACSLVDIESWIIPL
ncbi:MAG: prepilin peptidase, partial [Planctomycetota bacterium]